MIPPPLKAYKQFREKTKHLSKQLLGSPLAAYSLIDRSRDASI